MNWVLDEMEATSNRESDALEVTNLRGKQPSIMESQVLFPSNWPEASPHVLMDTQALDVQIVNRCVIPMNGSDTSSNDSHLFRVDNNDLVEELLMKNFKNPNLLVNDGSSKGTQMGQYHQLEVGSGKGNLHGGPDSKDKQLDTSVSAEAVGNMSLPGQKVREHLNRRQSNQDHNMNAEHLTNSSTISNSSLFLSDGIRTKFLSASGTSHFLVKNTLKGKGVVCKYPVTRDGIGVVGKGQNNEKVAAVARVVSDTLPNLNTKADEPSPKSVDSGGPYLLHEGINLADWLKPGYRKVDKVESLRIFGKILHLVALAHSQQIVLRDLRPSCFKLLPSNQVKYVGSLGQKELFESISDHEIPLSHNHLSTKRSLGESMQAYPSSLTSKHQKLSENMRFSGPPQQFPTRSGFNHNEVSRNGIKMQHSGNDTGERHNSMGSERRLWNTIVSKRARPLFTPNNVQLEDQWYTSPEELHERGSTFATNIYCLGVLLFELLCHSESREVHTSTMLKLHHRILPPNFLSENPKEAGFCLWLLHPVPSSRPTTREILQSELIGESQELLVDQSSLSIEEDDTESELLLHFLLSLKEQKHKHASKLVGDIESLQTDIQEVEKRYLSKTNGVLPLKQSNSSNTKEPKFTHKAPLNTEPLSRLAPVSDINAARLMKNINQLENAYFSMRSQIQQPDTRATARLDTDLLKNQSRSPQAMSGSQAMNQKPADRLGAFFEGLCKYARYGKFEVHGTLRNGDLLNSASANVICSLSFDRDEDFFAAAGVSKKIKIFDYHRLLDDAIDIHYPVVEMLSKSKLSCICWNNYIKNYLASTDYDGVVQLWDASTGQGFAQYAEHERRAWSVDFSPVDPRKLASGGDDCSVKLWTINEAGILSVNLGNHQMAVSTPMIISQMCTSLQKKCIGTIKNVANVCCVQFSAHSTNLLAFGSADYKTYCYDLRHTRIPWCTLAGHGKTVSYVKFLDEETLVSASTDNTLKLWDLNKTSSSALSTSCSLTFKGHTNEKNFVGLAVSDDGYIACGSETNEVYAYYKSLSMPITSHKFGSIDPISGQETSDDNGQFVSSVCWRKKSNTVVASNSSGTIKLLQML